MAKMNALGYGIGEIVPVDVAQRVSSEYNAALLAHINAHEPTRLDRWGYVERYGNQGGNHKGHDLDLVYPVLGRTGVSYVEFETGEVNNALVEPEPVSVRFNHTRWDADSW